MCHLRCEGHPFWIEDYHAPHYSLAAPVRLMCHLPWLASCPSWEVHDCCGFLAHPAGPVNCLPWFPGPPCRRCTACRGFPWPTLPGRCTTCRGFLGPPCQAGAPLAVVFLAHPAGPVHHLPWFSGPPCRASAPLAVAFLAHPARPVHHLPQFSWPTLPGRCTTCYGFFGRPCRARAPIAVELGALLLMYV